LTGAYLRGGDTDETRAIYNNYVGDTTAGGSFEEGKSPYGAYDMAGNVWEWVSSLYGPYPYAAGDRREALSNSGYAGNRGLRGGAWAFNDNIVHSAYRGRNSTAYNLNSIGFHCTRPPQP
jgi:formylglycine-generating enzyme required for sulfatase activity